MNRVLSKVRKNSKEWIQITLSDYHGRMIVDIRCYYQSKKGLHPTKKGFGISIDKLPLLYAAVKTALISLQPPSLDEEEREAQRRSILERAATKKETKFLGNPTHLS